MALANNFVTFESLPKAVDLSYALLGKLLFAWLLPGSYAPQLYRQVLLTRVLAMGILSVRLSVCLSVRLSVCHDPVVYQDQVR